MTPDPREALREPRTKAGKATAALWRYGGNRTVGTGSIEHAIANIEDEAATLAQAAPPPDHEPHCNDRCIHYLEGDGTVRDFTPVLSDEDPAVVIPRQGVVTDPSPIQAAPPSGLDVANDHDRAWSSGSPVTHALSRAGCPGCAALSLDPAEPTDG
jgi:hypothetical protein